MCSRYEIDTSPWDLARRFALCDPPPVPQAPELRPTNRALVIAGAGRAHLLVWGLPATWNGKPLINARAETLAAKPAFRGALARGRCLIPASGYFEWKRVGRTRSPMLVRRESGEPFVMAGLYERWQTPEEGILRSCTIITTEPNEVAASVHHRMPAILTEGGAEVWMDRELTDLEVLTRVLRPYPLGDLVVHPVSDRVNRAIDDDPSMIEPVDPSTPEEDPQLGLGL
ncbi:MAG: SOS response-associated peptidase [Alphaproteobacteria bacterium]|nr:SOS response-associated peptidase [Alphaproteobacteria bacterium]